MAVQNPLSIGEIAQDLKSDTFREELRSAWSIALLYRAPAVPVVWAAARLGLGPMQVTFAALLVALLLPVVAVGLPLAVAPIALCLCGMLFQVLDCADGMLARATGRSTKLGGDMDFLIDMAQWGLLYVSLGLLADRVLDTGWYWAMIGAAAAWGRLYARVVRDRLKEDAAAEPSAPGLWDYPALFLAGISGLIPFIALSGSWIGFWVGALLVYSILDSLEGLLPLFKRRA